MNQYEVPAFLSDHLPELQPQLNATITSASIFKTMQCFVQYSLQQLKNHDLASLKNCLGIAELVYTKGNQIVKGAIENVYVYSFSSLLFSCSGDERKQIQFFMPHSLYTIYIQQILRSGI